MASPDLFTDSPRHGLATRRPILAVYDRHCKKPQIPRAPLFPHILNLRKLSTAAILFSISADFISDPFPVLQEFIECKVCAPNHLSEPQLTEAWFPLHKREQLASCTSQSWAWSVSRHLPLPPLWL